MTLTAALALAVLGAAILTVLVVRFRALHTCSECNGWLAPAVREELGCRTCGGTGSLAEARVPQTAERRERAPEEAVEAYG